MRNAFKYKNFKGLRDRNVDISKSARLEQDMFDNLEGEF